MAYEFLIISGRLSVSKVAKRIPSQITTPSFCLLDFFSAVESPLLSLIVTEISIRHFGVEYLLVWLNPEVYSSARC